MGLEAEAGVGLEAEAEAEAGLELEAEADDMRQMAGALELARSCTACMGVGWG